MSTHNPRRMDEGLERWLREACGVKLIKRSVPNTLGSQTVAQAIRSRPDLARAMTRTRELLTPAPDATIADALQSLLRNCAKRRDDKGVAIEDRIERIAAKLTAYPEDIAIYALETWDDQPPPDGLHFPRWAQLRLVCEDLFAWRRAVLPALQQCEPFEEPKPQEVSHEERQGARWLYVEAMRRLGARPRPDLLPDGYDVAAYGAPLAAQPPASQSAAQGVMAKRLAERQAEARELAAMECAEWREIESKRRMTEKTP